jgi:MSHA biogenesis protein MshI
VFSGSARGRWNRQRPSLEMSCAATNESVSRFCESPRAVRKMSDMLRSREFSTTRSGVACAPDGCAIATIRRVAGGRHVLESCQSTAASPLEQTTLIAAWLAREGRASGAISSVLDCADYELVQVESPDVLPGELKAAVRWRLKDAIGFPVENAVVDVFDMPEPPRRTGARMVYAVAAKQQAIARQVAALKAASRRFDVIDIPELAQRNLMALMPEAVDGLILLWLEDAWAQVLVIKESTLYLTRHVQFAGNDTAVGGEPNVGAIALEVQRSMDYFESHYDQAPLRHLIIAPRDGRSERLAQALAHETSMRIQFIDLRGALEMAPGIDPADRRSLLAIGAALRDDRKNI